VSKRIIGFVECVNFGHPFDISNDEGSEIVSTARREDEMLLGPAEKRDSWRHAEKRYVKY